MVHRARGAGETEMPEEASIRIAAHSSPGIQKAFLYLKFVCLLCQPIRQLRSNQLRFLFFQAMFRNQPRKK